MKEDTAIELALAALFETANANIPEDIRDGGNPWPDSFEEIERRALVKGMIAALAAYRKAQAAKDKAA